MLKTVWTPEEDKILIDTILDSVGKGSLINDALVIATKKLETRTLGAVTTRWYENFKENYEEQIKRLRIITPVDDRTTYNSWSLSDEERLMNSIVNYLVDDIRISEALQLTAEKLGRSYKSCSQRWYNHVAKKNRLTVEQEVEKGKRRKQEMKQIFKEVDEEKQQPHKLFVKPANKLTDKQLQSWNEMRRYELFKIMMPSVIFDQSEEDLLALAAINFNRSASECKIVWENYVKGDKEFEAKFNSQYELEPVTGVIGKREIPKATVEPKQLEAELPVQEEEKQAETVSPQPNELLELIQNLINRNESLEKENAELKEELVKSKEIEQNYKEILDVMEKARQLVANSGKL